MKDAGGLFFRSHGKRGFLKNFLQGFQIFEKLFPSLVRNEDRGLGTRFDEGFFDTNGVRFLQGLQVTTQVAVREIALLLEFAESDAMRHPAEGGHDGQTVWLMEDSLQGRVEIFRFCAHIFCDKNSVNLVNPVQSSSFFREDRCNGG